MIIGADGLLGSYWLKKSLEIFPNLEIRGTSRRLPLTDNFFFLELSSSDLSKFKHYLKNFKPDAVIYLAGITNVDECEKEKKLAVDLNAYVPASMALECKKSDTKFVYISTDHLFGDEGSYFSEEDEPVLVNYYAYSKKLAEDMILKNHSEALIVRTNFYGRSIASKPSFTDWIGNELKEKREIKLGEDVYFNPVFMGDLVLACHLLLENDHGGIFNITSNERISKYNFALMYAKIFNLQTELIKPFSQRLHPKTVRRPLEMSLSNKKLLGAVDIEIGNTLEGFGKLKKEIERSAI